MKQRKNHQDLMILRCIRPDRVVPAVLEFVAGKLGEKFVNPPPFDLAGSYSDSNASWRRVAAFFGDVVQQLLLIESVVVEIVNFGVVE